MNVPAFRSFRHRNYRLFFWGQLGSLTGTWMQSTAQGWLVYRLTGSSFWLGLVSFCALLPVLLFSLAGGALADRFPKRTILLAVQTAAMIQAVALAWLTLAGDVQVWQIMALAVCLGLANAVEIPTRQSFLVEMVGREDLHNAIALNSTSFHLARVLGPSLAGLLVALIGEGPCFALNALSFLAVLWSLAAMRFERATTHGAPRAGLKEHVKEGVCFACRTPLVREVLAVVALASLMGVSTLVLLPVFAGDVFARGPEGLGILTASSGFGSMAGALAMACRRGATGLRGIAVASLAGLGACLLLFALAPSFWAAAFFLAPCGFCLMALVASCNTMVQLTTPDGLRGRVMSVFSTLYLGMAPFGSLLAGSMAQWMGAPAAVAILGGCCLAGALWPGAKVLKAPYNP
ncbi:MAG: MFS transporter [Thermodesulfobacteriota bacterium]